MIPARFLAEAMEELREAALFYEERQDGLGDRFLTEVRETVRKSKPFPKHGCTSQKHRVGAGSLVSPMGSSIRWSTERF